MSLSRPFGRTVALASVLSHFRMFCCTVAISPTTVRENTRFVALLLSRPFCSTNCRTIERFVTRSWADIGHHRNVKFDLINGIRDMNLLDSFKLHII